MIRNRLIPSPATALALLALFVALCSGAYAAATIGAGDIKPNAIHSRHIKDNQVKAQDLNTPSVSKLYGSGVLGGSGVVPALAANVPGVIDLPPIGDGGGFGMPAPAKMKLRQLTVRRGGVAAPTRPILVSVFNDATDTFLTCAIPIGGSQCASGAGQRVAFKPGQMIEARAIVLSTPAFFSGTELRYAYRAAVR